MNFAFCEIFVLRSQQQCSAFLCSYQRQCLTWHYCFISTDVLLVVSDLRRLRSQGSVLNEVRFGQVRLDLFGLVDSAAR